MLVVQSVFRCCHGEELGPFCWAMLATGIAALMHLVDVLSILLICNGFSGIQKALVDQTGSRPPNSGHEIFGAGLGLGNSSEFFSPATELVITSSHMHKFYFQSHVIIRLRNGLLLLYTMRRWNFKNDIFDFRSAHEATTYRALSPFQFSSDARWP